MKTTKVPNPGSRSHSARETDGPAARSLAEAEARRRERDATPVDRPREIDGRAGPEPVRYGDWENKGIVSDF